MPILVQKPKGIRFYLWHSSTLMDALVPRSQGNRWTWKEKYILFPITNLLSPRKLSEDPNAASMTNLTNFALSSILGGEMVLA